MIYDLIDLTNWKKKSQILKELKEQGLVVSERNLRKLIEVNNKGFKEHIQGVKFIAHSNTLGYIATTDENIIKQSVEDNKKRALTQLKIVSDTYRALGENVNFNLEME